MRHVRPPLSLLLVLFAAGCTTVGNPLYRAGTWHPTGANAANLAAMVANPHDLVEGEAAPGVPGPVAVMPVERLRTDKIKPLPDNSIVQIGGTSTGSSSGSSVGIGN